MKFKLFSVLGIAAILVIVLGTCPPTASAWSGQSDDTSSGQSFDDGSMPPPPPGGSGGKDLLSEFDADGDGQLSSDEFPGPSDHFTALDTDGDGYLSAAELKNGRPGPPKDGGFEKDDANSDGKVSQSEFSGPEELFSRMDANGDGYITKDELPQGGPHGKPSEVEEE